jgi:hypothetical protein
MVLYFMHTACYPNILTYFRFVFLNVSEAKKLYYHNLILQHLACISIFEKQGDLRS